VPREQLVFLQSSQTSNILHIHISRFYLQVTSEHWCCERIL